jgi:hypothetical protein
LLSPATQPQEKSSETKRKQQNPKIRLKAALEAATEFNMSVAAPYTYIQV